MLAGGVTLFSIMLSKYCRAVEIFLVLHSLTAEVPVLQHLDLSGHSNY